MLLGAGLHHSAADARRVGCLGGLSTRARFRRAVLPGETGGTAGSAEGAEEGPFGRLEVVVVVDPSFRATLALRRWSLRCLAFRLLLSFLPLEGGGVAAASVVAAASAVAAATAAAAAFPFAVALVRCHRRLTVLGFPGGGGPSGWRKKPVPRRQEGHLSPFRHSFLVEGCSGLFAWGNYLCLCGN
jgi:hypothetical protein